jgi:hypothetical protein
MSSRRSLTSTVLLTGALIGTGVALAGCQPVAIAGVGVSSASPLAGAAGNGSASAAPSDALQGSPAASPVGTVAAIRECVKATLSLSAGSTDSSSGHRSETLVFTNTSAATCVMQGYHGVAALDGQGSQVVQARRTPSGYEGGIPSGAVPPRVSLGPGQSASATVEALAFNASDGSACTRWAGLLVTVPDDTVSTRVPWNSDGCSDLQIHPVVPGTGRSTG